MNTLNDSNLEKIAKKIQRVAESAHCASAILSAEAMLLNVLKKEQAERIKEHSQNMEKALLAGEIEKARDFAEKSKEAREAYLVSPPRVRVSYEDISEDAARYTIADNVITIVLPCRHQEKILDGLEEGDIWSPEMKEAKNALRRLTLHEIGHIVTAYHLASGIDEDSIDEFAGFLFELRESRNKSMYCDTD